MNNSFELFGHPGASADRTTSENSQSSRGEACGSIPSTTPDFADSAINGIPTSSAVYVVPAKDSADWRDFDLSRVRFLIEEIPENERPKGSSLRFRIVAEYDGMPIMHGDRRLVVRGSLRPFSYQLEEKLHELTECAMCREQAFGLSGPEHKGSVMCMSGSLASGGRNPHCSCDTCW